MPEPICSIKDVREFFQSGEHGRPLPLDELKALSIDERTELRLLLDKYNEKTN